MNSLGAIMSRLSKVHFDKIGSLFEDDDVSFSVRECLSPVLTWQSRDSLDAEIDRAFLSHAEELPLSPYLFFSPLPKPVDYPTWDSYKAAVDRRSDFIVIDDKLEGSKNRLDYFIAGQILEGMVPLLLSQSTDFTMSHPDLHVGNIFGSTTIGPVTELLATPGLAGSSNPPSSSLVAAFKTGFSQESPNIEQGLWDRAEMIWYFSRLVRLLSGQDLPLFQTLYELVYKSEPETLTESINLGRLFHERAMLPSNKLLLSKLDEDDLSEEVKEREMDVFSSAKSDRLAIARKLTLISEMNPGFVGDRRLWLWLEDALKDSINLTIDRAVGLDPIQ
ncbi:hypothetical protein LCI18_012813 [Fusarium solani-melongenae]|uniref:Uncharacterized protein n=1 Tax=Fusarium solani subsp. cucurbitae TaxID=2747967 RepID=A0ACD3ZLB4_FUSSC|nr:hypothetical protein LCI18_012813 [Fusarium solani-melongenae]